jgi:hypothetical protein
MNTEQILKKAFLKKLLVIRMKNQIFSREMIIHI